MKLAKVVFLLSDLLVPLFHLLFLLFLLLFQFLLHVDLGLSEPVELLLGDIVFLWVFQLKAFFDLYLSNHIPVFLILRLQLHQYFLLGFFVSLFSFLLVL